MAKNRWETIDQNFLGETFPSGNNWIPSNVSQGVKENSSPQGKAFTAFCLISVISLVSSWYPFHLRNVYTPNDVVLIGRCRCGIAFSWSSFRHAAPPFGMLMVTFVPVTSRVNRTFGESVAVSLHTMNAILMIGGYCICELRCLTLRRRQLLLKPGEWCIRMTLASLIALAALCFEVLGAVNNAAQHWPCADVWLVPSAEHLQQLALNSSLDHLRMEASEARRTGKKLLFDTAHGLCAAIKRAEYGFEAFSGLCMAFSLLSIWWFCPERGFMHVDAELPRVSKGFLQRQGYDDEYLSLGVDSECDSSGGAEDSSS
eukprot:TRINITY_DN26254_c0_g1_i1.p1 TRINITY_DN26254_c0_g1~~TRINITY_DN26254_c0_g1_i1.p1  ORF type:complete len:315 (-),score=28.37 TRINITY_DN26254_c0_g1_i1:13-957(-)